VSGFQRSQGFLLAGAVAYYTLLAIVPLSVVLLVGLSHVVDEHRLLDTVASNLQLVIPGQTAAVTAQVESFLAHREVVGIVGLLALVFFSSTAFTVIESAMATIFHHRTATQHRHFLVSALLPYLFAVRSVSVFGYAWPPAGLLMVWYFAKLSMVNVIYGAMAAAIILLLGGEVIAEIDRARAGHARARQCR